MARQSFSDEQILAALREAARICGEPLSHGTYDGVARQVAGPSSARIIQRFSSWREACSAAGVTTTATSRRYTPKWDGTSVAAAVAQYLSSTGSTGTCADYQAWAREGDGRPSGATVRNVLGRWNEAKTAALSL